MLKNFDYYVITLNLISLGILLGFLLDWGIAGKILKNNFLSLIFIFIINFII